MQQMLKHIENRHPRIALLGVYLALYDTAFSGYRERMLRFVRDVASRMIGVEIPLIDAAVNDAEMRDLLARAAASDVDGIVLLSLGYTASLAVTEPLVSTPLPLLLLNTQEVEEVTSAFSFQDMVWNHGMQGIQDLAAALVRRGRKFAVVTGLLSQEDTRADLLDHLHAWRAARQIRGSRIGTFGPSMPNMGDAQVEPAMLDAQFGISTVPVSYEALGEAARRATRTEVESLREFDRRHFELAADLTPEDHERSTRLEIGLRQLVEQHALAGLQISFEQAAASTHIETIPFLGLVKLMAEGVGYAGEGDLAATAGGVIAHRLCGEVTFTEMYTMDFPRNATLHTHMAECNWRMARRDRKPRLLRREFTLAECLPFVSPAFSLEPGEVTLFDLAVTAEGEFRFITIEAEVDDFPPLAGMEVPNFKVRYRGDIRPMLNEYSLLGGTHHLSLTYGQRSRRTQRLAARLGVSFNHLTA